jgi:hypothetical protein
MVKRKDHTMSKIKCKISKYDINITEPPYELVQVGEFEIDSSVDDGDGNGGVNLYNALMDEVSKLGYNMHFYTTCPKDTEYKFNVVVYLTREEWPYCLIGHFGCHCLIERKESI